MAAQGAQPGPADVPAIGDPSIDGQHPSGEESGQLRPSSQSTSRRLRALSGSASMPCAVTVQSAPLLTQAVEI